MSPLEPCCFTCQGCERVVCRDLEISPGEVDLICPTCFETEAAA